MRIKINPVDRVFSEYVRKKSGGYCERCGKYHGWKGLQTCHFHGRRKQSTRYYEDNVVALDFGCHQYFHEHPEEFKAFMLHRLGQTRYDLLEVQARTLQKRPSDYERELLRAEFKKLIEEIG